MPRLWFLFLFGTTLAFSGEVPGQDQRLTEVRHTDTEFTDPIPAYDRGQWTERRERLRKQILSAAGLLPLPQKNDLRANVSGRLERGDYSIEKVVLETYPGFFLGGNLYRPLGLPGPHPAIASPHGHWSYGRLENQPLGSVPARAINLARQGYVVFAYDMVGYNDTRQFPHAKIGGKREELWSVGLLGLQLWNSIRVVDFLQSLPDVDRDRIGATGASGGGTQTFLLSAVDDRVNFSAPVNMVSSIMQGGSPCENAPNLRIDTNNVEIAALAAPRPMLIVAATGDWTKNVPRREFPAVQRIYRLMQAPDAVEAIQFDSPHNYHQQSREAVYSFFGKTILGQADDGRFAERAARIEQLSDMLAFWGKPAPAGVVDLPTFVAERIGDANEQIQQRLPYDATSLARVRAEFRDWLRYSILAWEPAADELVSDVIDELPNGEKLVIGRRGRGDRIPAVILRPKTENPALKPTLIVHPEGSAWVMSSGVSRVGLVSEILFQGGAVMGIDAFQTGHAAGEQTAPPTERAKRYSLTFNRTPAARRIQDVLTAIRYARTRFDSPEINLYCPGEAGLWCALARALADGGPIHLAADLNGFDASKDAAFAQRLFIPGLRKAGDFRAASTLWTDGKALLWNTPRTFPKRFAEAAFFSAGRPGALEIRETPMSDGELLLWLGAVRKQKR